MTGSIPTSSATCAQCGHPALGGARFCDRCGAALVDDALLGTLVDARYRVLERVGEGAMGVVYKVEHVRMGKVAAMKVLRHDRAQDRELSKRLRREAEAVSRLTHANTVQVFDFGTHDGALYLVMEYVRGESLGAIVDRDGPLVPRRAVELGIQICGSLGEAHELGIVHRDLKPDNVLISRTKDGREHVKVVDFGLAKSLEGDDAADETGRGTIMGTPHYMSPEQIRGEVLDGRSDLYALGALLYRMLTGDPPFVAESAMGVLTRQLTDEPDPPQRRGIDLPPRLEALVLRLLAKQRDQRPATAEEVRSQLESIRDELRAEGSAGSSRLQVAHARREVDGPATEARLGRADFDDFERSLRRRQLLGLVVAPLALAVAAVGVVLYLRWQQAQPRTAETEPNNDPQHATRIAPGVTVRGYLGKRLDPSTGDHDVYVLATGAKAGTRRRLAVELTPLPNVDVALVVSQTNGDTIWVADATGVAGSEVVPSLVVDVPELLLTVRESPYARSAVPAENASDAYQLTVTATAPAVDEEGEPNDIDATATTLAGPGDMHGTLGKLNDVDRFRFAGAAGRYRLELLGVEGIDVRIRVGESAVRGRSATVDLSDGVIVVVERVDSAPTALAGPPGSERPLAGGVAVPYTLRLAAPTR